MADDIYSVKQAAGQLGCSTERVRQLIRDGTLPAFKAYPDKQTSPWLCPAAGVHALVDAKSAFAPTTRPPIPADGSGGDERWVPSPAELAIAQGRISELEATIAELNARHARELGLRDGRIAELERVAAQRAAALRAQLDAFTTDTP